jgi:hypothetical protein
VLRQPSLPLAHLKMGQRLSSRSLASSSTTGTSTISSIYRQGQANTQQCVQAMVFKMSAQLARGHQASPAASGYHQLANINKSI